MRKIALIGCSKSKLGKEDLSRRFPAADIYCGRSFRKSKNFGIKHFGCEDRFYVLSALHGLLPCDAEITYYDKSLYDMSAKDRRRWAEQVYADICKTFDVSNTHFVIFAGFAYWQYLADRLNCTVLKYEGRNVTFTVKHVFEGGKR